MRRIVGIVFVGVVEYGLDFDLRVAELDSVMQVLGQQPPVYDSLVQELLVQELLVQELPGRRCCAGSGAGAGAGAAGAAGGGTGATAGAGATGAGAAGAGAAGAGAAGARSSRCWSSRCRGMLEVRCRCWSSRCRCSRCRCRATVQVQQEQVQGQSLEPGVQVQVLAAQVPELVLEPQRDQAPLVQVEQELQVLVQSLEPGHALLEQGPVQLRVRGQSLAQVQGVQKGKVQEQSQALAQQVLEPEGGDNIGNYPHSRALVVGRGMGRNHRAEEVGKELPCMDRGPDKEPESLV